MKHAILALALATAPVLAVAAEVPASAATGACVQPKIPNLSTSQVGVDRVRKSLAEWDACLARHPGTDTALVAKVSAQVNDWAAATAAYGGGQANGQMVVAQNIDEQRKHQQNARTDLRATHPQSAQDPL